MSSEALKAKIEGKVVTKCDELYPLARRNWDPWTSLCPCYIVYPANHRDIITCIEFCKCKDIPIRIRSGGHALGRDFSNVNKGLVVDLASFNTVRFEENYISLDVGLKIGFIIKTLAEKGYAVPFGDSSTVGIGFMLGGGIGKTNKQLGLGCDNLLGFTLVTADSKVLECSKNENANLYWALRGGGNGNYGVITNLKVKYNIAPEFITLINVTWTAINAKTLKQIIFFWLNTVRTDDKDLCTDLSITKNGSCLFDVVINGLDYGNSVLPQMTINGVIPVITIEKLPYSVMLDKLFPDDPPSTQNYKFTSFWNDKVLSERSVDIMIKYLLKNDSDCYFLDMGGKFSEIKPKHTAFYWRNAKYYFELSSIWDKIPKCDDINNIGKIGEKQSRALERTRLKIKDDAFGSYVNVPDNNIVNYEQEYFGKNRFRLRDVKDIWDPENFFKYSQSIKPSH